MKGRGELMAHELRMEQLSSQFYSLGTCSSCGGGTGKNKEKQLFFNASPRVHNHTWQYHQKSLLE